MRILADHRRRLEPGRSAPPLSRRTPAERSRRRARTTRASSSSTSPAAAARRCRSPCPSCRRRSAADTAAGNTEALGRQVAEIVATDLAIRGLFTPIGPERPAGGLLPAGDRARFRLFLDHRRAESRPGLRPGQWQRHAHRRLLSLRRRRPDRARPPGLCRRSRATGAAPRIAAPTPSIRG